MASPDRTGRSGENKTEPQGERQRLDKWLWFARVVKTRSAATRLVCEGHVRVNSRRIDTPAKLVTAGDVLTVALERDVRVLRIVAPGLRRGPYAEARYLFEELSTEAPGGPPPDPADSA